MVISTAPYLVTSVHFESFVVVSAEDAEVHVRLAEMAN